MGTLGPSAAIPQEEEVGGGGEGESRCQPDSLGSNHGKEMADEADGDSGVHWLTPRDRLRQGKVWKTGESTRIPTATSTATATATFRATWTWRATSGGGEEEMRGGRRDMGP